MPTTYPSNHFNCSLVPDSGYRQGTLPNKEKHVASAKDRTAETVKVHRVYHDSLDFFGGW